MNGKRFMAALAATLALTFLPLTAIAGKTVVSKLFGDVTLYDCPRVDCKVTAVLKGGETVETVKVEEGWALIRFGQVTGWVPRDYLGKF